MKIRPAQDTDFPSVKYLLEVLEEAPLEERGLRASWDANQRDPDVDYLIAERDASVVGFADVHFRHQLHHTGLVAELVELVVAQEQRSLGVGAALVTAVEQRARERGACQLELACNLRRERAHGFYRSHGFAATHFKFVKTLSSS